MPKAITSPRSSPFRDGSTRSHGVIDRLTGAQHDESLPSPSHTCEHLLVAVKMPAGHPREEPIPWDSDPTLRALRRGVDTDVVVAEVRETSRKPDEVYGVIER